MKTVSSLSDVALQSRGIVDALHRRLSPAAAETEAGRRFSAMSVLEMGREFLGMHGINTRGMSRLELSGALLMNRSAGMQTSGDFPSLLANVGSKRLRDAYDENAGTYTLWARRAEDAPDFRPISVVQLSGAPELLKTSEHGEFTYGTMKDGAESYAVITYGRIVSLSRQTLINDDLRGFDRMVSAFGASSRRLENRLVYSRLTGNANLSDGIALFHASHANLATGAGSALDATALATGRTAMRKQKGLQLEELNLAPAYLIVPAALEQTAYQLTSSQYVPATTGAINEFRAGGRTSLTPVVEPLLDANSATAWYLAARNSQVDTVEYCYLNGAGGPMIESELGFSTDGISFKCRLDFGAKDIDHRGLYRGAGA